MNKVPIGVVLGQSESKKLRRAVAILRFLHNANMREFQAQINDVINQLQAYTADPKTDADAVNTDAADEPKDAEESGGEE